MRFLAGVLVGVAAVGAAVLAFLASGLFEIAAAVPPGSLETHLARFALDRSVSRRAPNTTNPVGKDEDALREGREHYKDMCVTCHGAPGVDPSEIGEGLNPPAPDLTLGRVQARSDGELFWIVQNGIRMSAMPAFGATHKERQIWEIVAFLRHLPSITPEEEKALGAGKKDTD